MNVPTPPPDEYTAITPPDITVQRQSALLAELEDLAAERANTERSLASNRIARQNAANQAYHSLRDAEIRRNAESTDGLEKQRIRSIAEVRHVHNDALAKLDEEESRFERSAPREHEQRLDSFRKKARMATLRSEEQLKQATADLKQQWNAFEAHWNERQSRHNAAVQNFQRECKRRGAPTIQGDRAELDDESLAKLAPIEASATAIAEAAEAIDSLRGFQACRFFDEGWTILLLIFTSLAAIYPAGAFFGWTNWIWAAAALAAAITVTMAARVACGWRVSQHAQEWLPVAAHYLDASQYWLNQAWGRTTAELEAARGKSKTRRHKQIADIGSRLNDQVRNEQAAYESKRAEQRADFQTRRRTVEHSMQAQIQDIDAKTLPLQASEAERHRETMERLETENREQLERSQRAYDNGMTQLVDRWTSGLQQFQAEVGRMNEYCRRYFPDWEDTDWQQWRPLGPTSLPATAFPYGHYLLDVDDYGAPPDDSRLQLRESRFELPAALAFPQCPSLMLEASDDGKHAAVAIMQTLMLRMLMAIPPGKVRFTIIDPEALGQSFSAFMHLTDYDEQLVGPRIWTEPAHIQQQLADLTEHTENVIQKYLRNEFASIQEYNEQAGEVAEPYRILVVANFPEGFTDEAAKRLISIANTGAKCGVFMLISVDSRKKLPKDFFIDDLQTSATSLQWTHQGFRPREDRLRSLPLRLDSPPPEATFVEALRVIGRYAQEADNVEVPFDLVAPQTLWQADCSEELEVALGRAGATKLQHLRLGRGVSQHVLMAGKTGSGKSTLLHALITNVALHYSPDQVEFYLIDFKKGVEFKPYATSQLPHAQVIAIESEREFGMSVLERLDEELRRRGDLFRDASVQDLAGFRKSRPNQPMPRVLLIIDEFQELFVKDDRIASESSLLLDRLVRQGRAFGMHVLLGSQTLAGGYSLPRSTIGQMAVRIALQCSEADAHLILSEDNTAARLLNRPGEAIYNNANGRFEGNSPFQVVYLSDSERADKLAQIADEAARDDSSDSLSAPIVFEGNVPANPLRTPELLAHLRATTLSAAPRAWLGAAVAIKPPTATVLPRQSGANLLVAGPQEEMALGVLCTAAASLQTHGPVTVFDGSRAESGLGHVWPALQKACGNLELQSPKAIVDLLEKWIAEMERREAAQDDHSAPQFLILHNLARFRDLRRSEDDYSFSFSEDEGASQQPDKLLRQLLREGPAWGLHTLVWADSFNTASRWFDRQTLKDFEQRVLFQMTAADSSNLMDSPAASQLGVHRAILYTEEHGSQEKFRPFAPPSETWLEWLADNQPLQAGDDRCQSGH